MVKKKSDKIGKRVNEVIEHKMYVCTHSIKCLYVHTKSGGSPSVYRTSVTITYLQACIQHNVSMRSSFAWFCRARGILYLRLRWHFPWLLDERLLFCIRNWRGGERRRWRWTPRSSGSAASVFWLTFTAWLRSRLANTLACRPFKSANLWT